MQCAVERVVTVGAAVSRNTGCVAEDGGVARIALIVDEVLAVGDAEFQKKCLGKMSDVAAQGRTVLFVSHNIAAIKELCTKGIVLHQGEIHFSGNQTDAIDKYHEMNRGNVLPAQLKNEQIEILNFTITPDASRFISISSGFIFSMDFIHRPSKGNLAVTFEVVNKDEVVVFHHGEWICSEKNSQHGRYSIQGTVPGNTLNAGNYFFNVIIATSLHDVLLQTENIAQFEVENETLAGNNSVLPGVLRPNIQYVFNYTDA